MADTNAQMEELGRILEQVNAEMAAYGRITKQTADDKFDAEVKAKTGINNATKAMDKMGDAVGYVAGAAMSAGKAMADGKKGASAFNESVDDMAKAAAAAGAVLTLMIPGGPLIKLFFAGVTAAVGAVAAYTKATNTMADQLYKTYSGLSKAGGSASDGMSGVLKASNQLGLSMEEMDGFVGQITANSKDLALFSGSVFEGRQKLGDMGDALRGSREDFLKMGMSMTDVSDGMLGYLKIQTRLGQSQNKTTAELADGAKKYLVEQDALSKLTGQTRKEMEDQRERALQGEQFAAKIRQLQLEGNDKAAQELLKLNSVYEAAGPKMAAAFQASVTGNLSNADAQEANLASNGAMLETTQKVIAGQMSYTDAATQTGVAMGKTADTVGVVLGQFGAYNESFGPINEQLKLAQLAQGDITSNMAKIKEDQKKVLEGGVDPLLAKQAELINTQIKANEAFKIFISNGIGPAQDAMIALANATLKAGNFLGEMTGSKGLIQRTVDMINAKDSKELAKVGGNETFGELAGGAGGGIAAGAIAGGLIGSIVPVVGTAIGAAIGGALGAWGGSKIGGTIGKYVDETTKEEADKSAKGKPVEKRASGGPVDAKTPYLIGENGPELFVPSASGDVISNSAMKALGSTTNTTNTTNAVPSPMGKIPNAMPAPNMFKDTERSFDKILSTLNMSTKSMTTGYQDLDSSFNEVLSTVDVGSKSINTGYKEVDDSFDKILSTLNMSTKSMTSKHQDLDGSFDNILSTLNMSSESMTTGYRDLDGSFDKILSTVDTGSKSMTTGYRDLDGSFKEMLSTVDAGSKSMTAKHQDLDGSFDNILSTVKTGSKSLTSGYQDLASSFDKILSTLSVDQKSMTTGYQDLNSSFNEMLSTVDAGSKSMTTKYQDLDGSFDKILSTLNMSSESMTNGYQDLDGSFKEMLLTVDAGAKSITTKHQDLDGSFDNILSTVDTGSKSLTIKYQDLDNSFDKILSTLNVVSKSMTTGYRELDDSFIEIAKDSSKIEKFTDSDTKRAEKYSMAYKSYVGLKTQLMDLESPDLKTQIDLLQQKALQTSTTNTAGATSSQQGTPSTTGSGLKMPATSNMPGMGGGQGVTGGVASQSDLTKMGLKLKKGDVQAEGSKIDPKIIDLAQQVQASLPNFSYFSGFNDKFHQEKSPSSSHTTGRAMDFALSKEPSKEEGQEIVKWLKGMGASVAIDEYNNPSAKSTAGHIHAQIPGYADGGVASSPQIAMVAEKGPEAMIPLVNGAIPINLNLGPSPKDDHMSKIFEAGFGELSTQFAKLNDIDLIKSTIADFKNGQFGLKDAQELLKSNSPEAKTALDDGAQKYERMLADALEKQAAQQAEHSSRMIDALSEMIRTQKDSNSIQERILQTSM